MERMTLLGKEEKTTATFQFMTRSGRYAKTKSKRQEIDGFPVSCF